MESTASGTMESWEQLDESPGESELQEGLWE